jgi:hypothetical protein
VDDDRRDREMQEDVEVLRQIAGESVQQLYQQADERVARTCATCHTVQAPLVGRLFTKPTGGGSDESWSAAELTAIHAHWPRWPGKEPGEHVRVSALANYLSGHGIVIQMEAPAPIVDRDVKPFLEADEAAPKRWEVLLRQMRGDPEKGSPAKPLVVPPQYRRVHRLILTEKIVDLLAENGRNLRHLTPEEHVTVAFTFRTPTPEQRDAERRTLLRHYFPNASSAPATGLGPMPEGGMVGGRPAGEGNVTDPGAPGSPAAGGGPGGVVAGRPGGGAFPQPAGGPGGGSEPNSYPRVWYKSPSVRTSAVAGDLLLRQERYAEAVAAYEKALKESGIDVSDAKAPLPADAAEVVRKLVQAHVGAKNGSRAKDMLDWLERSQASGSDETTALRRIYLDLTGLLPTPDDVKSFLNDTRPNRHERLLKRLLTETQEGEGPAGSPARMTISCTRKQLDDVATGKLSKLDFAAKVSLKYFKASAAGTKDARKMP